MPRHDRRRGSNAGINKGDAGDQIAMIAGSADAPIHIRAIHGDRGEGGRQKHPSHEYEGALVDIAERTQQLNRDGYNIYMVAQPTKPLTGEGHFTRDADILLGSAAYTRTVMTPSFRLSGTSSRRQQNQQPKGSIHG